jgi:hypothetical protein
VEGVLQNVCPNCGGGFTPRPVRPARNWRGDNFLGIYPATSVRRHRPVDMDDHARFVEAIRGVPPNER